MPFDPDSYLKEKESGASAFDPDAYLKAKEGPSTALSGVRKLAHGVLGSFSDEVSGGIDALGRAAGVEGLGSRPVKDISLSKDGPTIDLDKLKEAYRLGRDHEREGLKEDSDHHPVISALSEIAGAVASPINKVVKGMSIAKAGATLGAINGLGASDSEDAVGMAKDTALGGVTGLVTGKVLSKAGQVLSPIVKEGMSLTPKANAAEIIEAAKRAGVTPTPGMLFENPVLGGLESSLSQSPSLPGMLMRKSTEPVGKSIESAATNAVADASAVSQYGSGQQAKAGIKKAIEEKFAAPRAAFQDLAESTPHMDVDPKSVERVANNITNLDQVQLMPGSEAANKAEQYASYLKNAKTVEQVKKVRQAIGQDLASAEGPTKDVLNEVYKRASRLEQNSMMRNAIETNRSFARSATGKTGDKMAAEGEAMGKDMVAQLKGANRQYSSGMNDISEFTQNAGMKKAISPDHFVSKIEGLDSERVADTLYNPSDYRMMQTLQKQFPKEAEILRQAQVASLERGATNADGSLSTKTLFRKVNKLGDESANTLLGSDKLAKIKDAQTLMDATPDYVGPSGTPKGMQYLGMLNPMNQLSDVGRYATYKALVTLGKAQNSTAAKVIAEHVAENPKLAQLAKVDPKAFETAVIRLFPQFDEAVPAIRAASNKAPVNELDTDSSAPASYKTTPETEKKDLKREPQSAPPTKGTEKWVSDGFENVAKHDETLDLDKAMLLKDPKSKQLLIAASDLKPGSRAMNDIVRQLKNRKASN